MLSLSSNLEIDSEQVTSDIEQNIRKLVQDSSARGVMLGLSGGIDSAVLAALAMRALDKKQVVAYYLYDRDNSRQSRHRATLTADWLDIPLHHHDISGAMEEMDIYSPAIMKITALSARMNRWLNNVHRLLGQESPFVWSLRRGSLGNSRVKEYLYRWTVEPVHAAFNARHIYRRRFLEQESKEKNFLLLGAANRSELMVGWFVKDGIDDLALSPILGLYKTQVRQVAEFLGLPLEIRNQVPSPDMAKGITDESSMGRARDQSILGK